MNRLGESQRASINILVALGSKAQSHVLPAVLSQNLRGGAEHASRAAQHQVGSLGAVDEERLCQLWPVDDGDVGAAGVEERVLLKVNAKPDKHASARPVKLEELCLGDDVPVRVWFLRGRLLQLEGVVLEDCAHACHAALVLATETFEPAHPAVELPALEVGLFGLREGAELCQGRGVWAEEDLGDKGLDKA